MLLFAADALGMDPSGRAKLFRHLPVISSPTSLPARDGRFFSIHVLHLTTAWPWSNCFSDHPSQYPMSSPAPRFFVSRVGQLQVEAKICFGVEFAYDYPLLSGGRTVCEEQKYQSIGRRLVVGWREHIPPPSHQKPFCECRTRCGHGSEIYVDFRILHA